MTDTQQMQYDASPERIDITIFGIIDAPVLKNGVCVEMKRLVDYSPAGTEDMVRMQVPVEDLLCVEENDDPHSVQHNIARARAALVMRALARRDHESETPDGHFALETWGGLTPVMQKSLRKCGIRSLQELAGASEATISRMGGIIINPRKLIEQCRMYLSSMDKTQAAAELLLEREKSAEMAQRVEEMEAKFAALLSKLNVGDAAETVSDEAPKRRGRRSNAEIEAERAAQVNGESAEAA